LRAAAGIAQQQETLLRERKQEIAFFAHACRGD